MNVQLPSVGPDPYRDGATMQEAAEKALLALLQNLEAGEVSHYAMQKYRAVQFTLAGGGPGTWVTFLIDVDGDIDSAVVTHLAHTGSAVPVPGWALQRLYDALRSYGG